MKPLKPNQSIVQTQTVKAHQRVTNHCTRARQLVFRLKPTSQATANISPFRTGWSASWKT